MRVALRILFYSLLLLAWSHSLIAGFQASAWALVVYLLTGGQYTLYLVWGSLLRDLRGAFRYIRLLSLVYYYQKLNLTVPQAFAKTVNRHENKTAIIFEDKAWTFKDLEDYSNRVANYFLRAGYKPGQCIALFMENRPEYVGLWLGCSKIGLVPALINSNLAGQSLLHSINAACARGMIFGGEYFEVVKELESSLSDVELFASGGGTSSKSLVQDDSSIVDLDMEIVNSSVEAVPQSVQTCTNFNDKLLYIFTSGTTGLPKAAVIKNSRFYFYCAGMYYLNDLASIPNLVLYDPLPLYHSAGGIVGIGLMMVFGSTVVIRKKFSVRNFWKDCCKYNCNAAQYIGEICRYLLSAPETPEERRHNVQLMFGNGLRPQIWDLFVRRFNIKRVGEFYGATEGNSSVVNIDGKQGAVGFTSVLFPFVYPVRLIKVNENGDVVRDKNGLCVLCKPGEPGEFIGKIVKNHPSRGFDGYVDKEATQKKIAHDVMCKGDMWFRSGDLLIMDEFGWMYFVDRMGDTFRWRGENVSTIEVEAVLSTVLQQQDTIVYGVEVPGVEGRCGMACIVAPSGGLDLASFLAAVKKQLPSYATPIFLRLVQQLDLTGTFKLKKIVMQQEGYNPNVIQDQMFFLDAVKGAYRQLDKCLYNDIIEMRCRL